MFQRLSEHHEGRPSCCHRWRSNRCVLSWQERYDARLRHRFDLPLAIKGAGLLPAPRSQLLHKRISDDEGFGIDPSQLFGITVHSHCRLGIGTTLIWLCSQ